MRWCLILLVIPVMVYGGILTVLEHYLPEARAQTIYDALIEEHEQCSEVDPVIVLAIMGTETGFKNVIGDNGKAVGYMQLHREAVWYVNNFYPDVKKFYKKIKKHDDLIKFPVMQIRIGYRYLCLLTKNCGGNVLCAIERYNGSKEYVGRVLEWMQRIWKLVVK